MRVKKRRISAILTLILFLSLTAVTTTDAKAAEEPTTKAAEELPIIDGT